MNKTLKHFIILFINFFIFSLIFLIFTDSEKEWSGMHQYYESFNSGAGSGVHVGSGTGSLNGFGSGAGSGVHVGSGTGSLNGFGSGSQMNSVSDSSIIQISDSPTSQDSDSKLENVNNSITAPPELSLQKIPQNIGITFFNYFYFCSTTFSSVGYGDIYPISKKARIFVMLLHAALTAELLSMFLIKE
jgi:hypothetical protein